MKEFDTSLCIPLNTHHGKLIHRKSTKWELYEIVMAPSWFMGIVCCRWEFYGNLKWHVERRREFYGKHMWAMGIVSATQASQGALLGNWFGNGKFMGKIIAMGALWEFDVRHGNLNVFPTMCVSHGICMSSKCPMEIWWEFYGGHGVRVLWFG